jgi:hypothetical protein
VVASLLSATFEVQRLAALAGLVLLLVGFGLGLPDSDEGLLGEVLPEEAMPGA